jgi:hypothetical protein
LYQWNGLSKKELETYMKIQPVQPISPQQPISQKSYEERQQEKNQHRKDKLRKMKGYSLVEVLVAGLLTALIVISVIACIRTGLAIDVNDLHRRQARGLINDSLEAHRYQPDNILQKGIFSSTVTIDPANNLTGNMTIAVDSIVVAGSTLTVIRMSIAWKETDFNDSLSVERWY